MTKYDKIYIPCSDNDRDCSLYSAEDVRIPMQEKENVIVLTTNELWDMWNECSSSQVDSETYLKNVEMFNKYLTSKGIIP